MTQYSTLNVKLPNSKLNQLKSEIKNSPEATLNFSENVVGDSNDEDNFPHKLSLTNTPIAFGNNSLANIKLSKTQLHKVGQS